MGVKNWKSVVRDHLVGDHGLQRSVVVEEEEEKKKKKKKKSPKRSGCT